MLRPHTGLLCFADWLASPAMIALRRAGLSIPTDVAVVGIGDDELQCNAVRSTLTSVDLNPLRVGHDAAQLLHHILSGKPPPHAPIPIPPLGVIERGSSQLMACEDPDVAAVLFIERQLLAGHHPTVDEVCAHTLVPRRTLDTKFLRHLNDTPADIAARHQLRLALRLLERSDAKLHEIATRTGFRSVTLLARAVKKQTGRNLTAYRHWARIDR